MSKSIILLALLLALTMLSMAQQSEVDQPEYLQNEAFAKMTIQYESTNIVLYSGNLALPLLRSAVNSMLLLVSSTMSCSSVVSCMARRSFKVNIELDRRAMFGYPETT